MKDEIKEILVISNTPARDIQEFNKYCKGYVEKCEGHKIYLKDGYILRFYSSHNMVGIRKYYLYHEIFETYLKNYITNLQEEKEDYKSRCGNSINFIDQVLQFHLSRFDKKQIDEDINTLIGILSKRGDE